MTTPLPTNTKQATKLSDDHAIRRTPYGWYVFEFFEDDGEVRQYAHSSGVVLNEHELRGLLLAYLRETLGCEI